MSLILLSGSFEKSPQLVQAIRQREPPIPVPETQSTFINAHNETLSIIAMRVNNSDRSPPENQRLRRNPSSIHVS
jgi:hypothetical protein